MYGILITVSNYVLPSICLRVIESFIASLPEKRQIMLHVVMLHSLVLWKDLTLLESVLA